MTKYQGLILRKKKVNCFVIITVALMCVPASLQEEPTFDVGSRQN